MARHKIHKKLKIAIVILLIAVLSFETHKMFKRNVVYKKPSKPIQGKKVKIKKIKSKTKKAIQKTTEVNPIQEEHEESIELHNKIVQNQREQYTEDYKQKQIALQKQQEEQIQWFPIRVSYYTNSVSDCGKTDAIGKNNKKLHYGDIAAPNLAFGTQINIQGLGSFTVSDRGGLITWQNGVMWVDVFIPDVSDAYIKKRGVQYTQGYIIK